MRAIGAAGITSAFSIVPVASPSVTSPPEAFDNVSVSSPAIVRVVEHRDLDRR